MRVRTARFLSVALLISAAVAARGEQPGDPRHGQALFLQSCAVCHATGTDVRPTAGQGPLLAGVLGRPAADMPNFGYTRALQRSHLRWDAATLDRFLANPSAAVPGTAMVVAVPSAADRADLIAFLATLKPVTLPKDVAPAAPSADDWRHDAPGVIHHVFVERLPGPFVTASASNSPRTVDRPEGAQLAVPAGFTVAPFVTGLEGPRLLRTAPNGDVFVAETRAGDVRVLRLTPGAAQPVSNTVFARHLHGPFGIAFYPTTGEPEYVYIGELNQVVRYRYRSGDLEASGRAEVIVPRLADTTGGHTTRDLAFSADGRRLLISVGSGSNVAEEMEKKSPEEISAWESGHGLGAAWGSEANRADVLFTDPLGKAPLQRYATGIRNAVGIAVQPATGVLWVSTNERDGLGDDLVPDYITRVREGGYYGWPWYYLGNHEDPRHAGERPDLAGKAIVPDVLLQSHSASLELAFYSAHKGPAAFPSQYDGDIFAAEHGSWNRATRTGSKVIRVHLRDGMPTGEYEDFLTGFIVNDHTVWGRPVGVAVAPDGALLVSDDAGDLIWRIAYQQR